MNDLLEYLVLRKYSVQIKGKSWHCLISKYSEDSIRLYKVSSEVVFTPEMVKSVTVFTDHTCLIELIN